MTANYFAVGLLLCSSIFLQSCNSPPKLPHYEMASIERSYIDEQGYIIVDFIVTNTLERNICVPESMFENDNDYLAVVDIRTGKNRMIKKKSLKGRPVAGSQEPIPLENGEQLSNSILIRGVPSEPLIKADSLTIKFKFWSHYCDDGSPESGVPNFYIETNRVEVQK